MTIIVDDVSWLIRLLILEILLDHYRISRSKALGLMGTQLGVDLGKAQGEIEDTNGCQARFPFLSKNHIDHLKVVMDYEGDDA